MSNQEQIVSTLGELLFQAARASIARGAEFKPGENISRDAEGAWKIVAEVLVKLVDAKLVERLHVNAEGLQEGVRPVPQQARGDQEEGHA